MFKLVEDEKNRIQVAIMDPNTAILKALQDKNSLLLNSVKNEDTRDFFEYMESNIGDKARLDALESKFGRINRNTLSVSTIQKAFEGISGNYIYAADNDIMQQLKKGSDFIPETLSLLRLNRRYPAIS